MSKISKITATKEQFRDCLLDIKVTTPFVCFQVATSFFGQQDEKNNAKPLKGIWKRNAKIYPLREIV